jgi:hypothetical protein
MQMDVTLVSNWLNCWAFKTFDTPQDFTDIKFYMLWIKGDPANIGSRTPTLMFYLEDQDVHRLIAKCNSALKKDGWTCYFFDADYDSDGNEDTTNATFWQDKWDTAGDCDITKIKKLAIAIQDNQGTADPSYSFSVLADGLVSGVLTSGLPPASARTAWCLYE